MLFASVVVLPYLVTASSSTLETCFDIGASFIVLAALLACFAAPLLGLQESDLRTTLYTSSESEQSRVQHVLLLLTRRPLLLASWLLLRTAGLVALPLLLTPHLPSVAVVAVSVTGFLLLGDLLPYVCFARKLASSQRLLPLARVSMAVCFPLACLITALPCFEPRSSMMSCQDLKHLVDLHDCLTSTQAQGVQSLLRAKKEIAGAHMTSLAKALTVTEEELGRYDVLRKMSRWGVSRVPVLKEGVVIGILLVKELLSSADVKLQTPLVVTYDTSLFTVLQKLSDHGGDLAVVTSSVERSQTPMGIISLQQVLQALLGVSRTLLTEDRLKLSRGALEMETAC